MKSNVFGYKERKTSVVKQYQEPQGTRIGDLHTGEGRLSIRPVGGTLELADIIAFIQRTSLFRSSLTAATAQVKLYLLYCGSESTVKDVCDSLGGHVDFNSVVKSSFDELVSQLIEEDEADSIARMLVCMLAFQQVKTEDGINTLQRLLKTEVGREALGMLDPIVLRGILNNAGLKRSDTIENAIEKLSIVSSLS